MVSELLVRTINALMEAGYTPGEINGYMTDIGNTFPEKTIAVRETYSTNRYDEEIVTVKIIVMTQSASDRSSYTFFAMTKVPKDASDKVLANRVQKAIAEYNRA